MIPKIFVSWSSPDANMVRPLTARLRAVFPEVWEYTDDLPAGANIHDEILNAINQVRMAIICFSDETAESDWIRDEASWCYKTLKDGIYELQHIIPVWVGPHPKNKVPKILNENHFRVDDLSSGREEDLVRFVEGIFKLLDREAPQVIPTALFAMTREQCKALLAKKKTAQELEKICLAAGMTQTPPIMESLCKRYGATPDDLEPFEAGEPFRQIVENVLTRANKARAAARPQQRPLFLWWMRDELVGPAKVATARTKWAEGSSLLIIDSVSAYHPGIRKRLDELPEPNQRDRAALLWLPPYTRHTVFLEQELGPAAAAWPRLGDAFNNWRDDMPARALAFDTGTLTATKRWLHGAFVGVGVDDKEEPVDAKRAAFEQAITAARFPGKRLLPGSAKGGPQ